MTVSRFRCSLSMSLSMLLSLCVASASQAQDVTARIDRSRVDELMIPVPKLAPDGLRVRVFLPGGYDPGAQVGYPVLYLNDGQDAEAVALQATLDALIDDGAIRPLIAVAIDMPKDRMGAYGFSDRARKRSLVSPLRVGAVGTAAHAYSEWVATQLIPAIDAKYRTRARADARTVLGWSLGAANALNLSWRYPEVFANVGAFSPSLWLSPKPDDSAGVQAGRFAQSMIAAGTYHAGSRFFFAVGDAEETDDRDGDGVIDVLDDARDLIDGWRAVGDAQPRAKGLRQLGHSVNLDHAARATRADASLFVLAGGKHQQASWAAMLPVFLRWAYAVHAPPLNATGNTESWQRMPSRYVDARDVDVWLPPGYDKAPDKRYPVLYMHDGQNLFDPALSYTGVDWDIDGAMTRLIEAGEIREAIVVGIWNTPSRFAEYMPKAPVRTGTVGSGIIGRPMGRTRDLRSDDYLRFLVEELKPFVDAHYRTLPGRDDTAVMGSSMGGLISLYAAARYPQVFGGVGAVSTHFPACGGCVIDWFGAHLPDPQTHRLYFDHGTATLDAKYPRYQAKMDAVLRAGGYREADHWITRRFEGAEHNEAAWRARVEIPLRFLLAPKTKAGKASP
jgi:enterochelin esterase-like enzyme